MLIKKEKGKRARNILAESMKIFEELDSRLWISRTRNIMKDGGLLEKPKNREYSEEKDEKSKEHV